jgi:hypothetical protein
VIISMRRRFPIVLIIRRQLVIKLNEVLVPAHMSALVLNKALPVFLCEVINVHLVILLIKYTINAHVSIPRWNWAAINASVSRRIGLADRHHSPLLMVVHPDIDGFGDVVHRMRRIHLFFIERGQSAAAATPGLWAKASQNRVLWYS